MRVFCYRKFLQREYCLYHIGYLMLFHHQKFYEEFKSEGKIIEGKIIGDINGVIRKIFNLRGISPLTCLQLKKLFASWGRPMFG